MATTPILGITELTAEQKGNEVLVNEAIRKLETLHGGYVVCEDEQTTPPGSPNEGEAYIVLATGTGAWAGQDGDVAYYLNATWLFITPFEGLLVYLKDVNNLEIYTTTSFRTALHSALPTS